MNDPHFTGRIIKTEQQNYTSREGNTVPRMVLHLQTEEAKPQRLVLRLSPNMTEQLQLLKPEEHRVIVTAYIYFRQFEYEVADELREGQEVCAWKLECTFEDNHQIYTIYR